MGDGYFGTALKDSDHHHCAQADGSQFDGELSRSDRDVIRMAWDPNMAIHFDQNLRKRFPERVMLGRTSPHPLANRMDSGKEIMIVPLPVSTILISGIRRASEG